MSIHTRHISIPSRTHELSIKQLGLDYFAPQNISASTKVELVEEMSKKIAKPTKLGQYDNQDLYLYILELFMAASYEKEHRIEIVSKEIISKLKNFSNFLDIGIGGAELTKFIGQHFQNITVIDNNMESLANMPDFYGQQNANVTKICQSILDINLPANNYDLILLSHTIYYIEDKFRLPLFDKLYNSLNKDGIISIIYNYGLGRTQLVKSFSDKTDNLGGFIFDVMHRYEDKAYALSSIEIMNSVTVWPMMHVVSLMLFDAEITVDNVTLSSYLQDNNYNGSHYQIDMMQNFLFVGASDDTENIK